MTRTQERERSTAYEQASRRDAAHVAIPVQAPVLACARAIHQQNIENCSSSSEIAARIVQRRAQKCVSQKRGGFDCCPSNDSTRQEVLIRQCAGIRTVTQSRTKRPPETVISSRGIGQTRNVELPLVPLLRTTRNSLRPRSRGTRLVFDVRLAHRHSGTFAS